ncbi:hypothetical protein F2Q69_00046114 [Brassica cretica]|uniref:SNARE associated Golgi protein n=1 Tax=Brassica cretica TaxID=69181 RepID=A0A8S9PN10_BRACR|nr:hypothetical protein F2Q69_00046114 [Brassica cretica]
MKKWILIAATVAIIAVIARQGTGWSKEAALEALKEWSDRLGIWAIPTYVAVHTVTLALCLPHAVFFEAGASILFGFLPALLCVFSAKVLAASFSFWIGSYLARAIEKAIDSAILSRRWIPLHGYSLATSLLSRRGFCLAGALVSTVLLSLILNAVQRICCLSRRRISLHGDSLETSLLSRWGFCLDSASVSTVLLSLISNAVQRICCLTDNVLLNTKVKKVCVPPPY